MRFFPREISEKLIALGCRSESGYWYRDGFLKPFPYKPQQGERIPAFIEQDFTGTKEYARENCRKLWPPEKYHYGTDWRDPNYKYYHEWMRHTILDSPDGIAYIVKILEGK